MWNKPSENILKKIPMLYTTEDVPAKDKMIYIHFFLVGSNWYIAEFDGDDIFFGFACLNGWKDCAEWGNIRYSELKEMIVNARISLYGQEDRYVPLEVDRDLNWKPKKASKIALIRECQGW